MSKVLNFKFNSLLRIYEIRSYNVKCTMHLLIMNSQNMRISFSTLCIVWFIEKSLYCMMYRLHLMFSDLIIYNGVQNLISWSKLSKTDKYCPELTYIILLHVWNSITFYILIVSLCSLRRTPAYGYFSFCMWFLRSPHVVALASVLRTRLFWPLQMAEL